MPIETSPAGHRSRIMNVVSMPLEELKVIPLALFLEPKNDREDRNGTLMERMTESISKDGFLQPIRCVPEMVDGKERYRVVTGWTRVLCGRRAGKTEAPAVIIRRSMTES